MKKFMLLPKPDDVHYLITIGLDPPLRQGQTRYPFLVMQFKKDEEVNLDLNMTEKDLQEKYGNKLQANYEAPISTVIAQIFRGMSGKKIITPSRDFSSHHQQSGVKCSIKANEGHLFCLDKSFMFVPKPATYLSLDQIQSITMSRVGGAISASRTFDITITMKNGAAEHQFSNINREEQQPLEDFFRAKNLKFKNEMTDDVSTCRSFPNIFTFSPLTPQPHSHQPSSLRLSRMATLRVATKKVAVFEAAPLTTTRRSTRTSRRNPSPKWARSLTRHTKVAGQGVTRRWQMPTPTMASLIRPRSWRGPRRRSRLRSNGGCR